MLRPPAELDLRVSPTATLLVPIEATAVHRAPPARRSRGGAGGRRGCDDRGADVVGLSGPAGRSRRRDVAGRDGHDRERRAAASPRPVACEGPGADACGHRGRDGRRPRRRRPPLRGRGAQTARCGRCGRPTAPALHPTGEYQLASDRQRVLAVVRVGWNGDVLPRRRGEGSAARARRHGRRRFGPAHHEHRRRRGEQLPRQAVARRQPDRVRLGSRRRARRLRRRRRRQARAAGQRRRVSRPCRAGRPTAGRWRSCAPSRTSRRSGTCGRCELERARCGRSRTTRYGQPWGGSWFPDGRRIAYSHEDRLIVRDLEIGRGAGLPDPASRDVWCARRRSRRTAGASCSRCTATARGCSSSRAAPMRQGPRGSDRRGIHVGARRPAASRITAAGRGLGRLGDGAAMAAGQLRRPIAGLSLIGELSMNSVIPL